jgi:hypothetical protein
MELRCSVEAVNDGVSRMYDEPITKVFPSNIFVAPTFCNSYMCLHACERPNDGGNAGKVSFG